MNKRRYLDSVPPRKKPKRNLYTVGAMVDALYNGALEEEFMGPPAHNYDVAQSDEWVDAHGYYPDERGHRDDRVKKEAHPSHPSRGTFSSHGRRFELSDKGIQDVNYIYFGLNDGGQDPNVMLTHDGAIVLPEITITPDDSYIENTYDNIRLHYKKKRRLKDGGIYIKPSHRGRFTALKERTGHSSTWFKEHGTPAQKKMATFALNAAKWKH